MKIIGKIIEFINLFIRLFLGLFRHAIKLPKPEGTIKSPSKETGENLNPHNNRKTTRGRKRQIVYDRREKVFCGFKTTKSGDIKCLYKKQPVHQIGTIIHT